MKLIDVGKTINVQENVGEPKTRFYSRVRLSDTT